MPSFLRVNNIPLCVNIIPLSIHSSVYGNSGLCPPLGDVNKAAMNTGVQLWAYCLTSTKTTLEMILT